MGAFVVGPIVELNIDMFAAITPDEFFLKASLRHSTIAGIAISGDLALLIRWASDNVFAFSASGFFPTYKYPPKLAGLQRLAIKLDLPVNLHAAVPVSFDITETSPPATPPFPELTQTVSRTLTLRRPADVIGIDHAQIVRRFPAPNVALGDDSSLAPIEFNRPDLPWLHSPVPADAIG